jgi:hypothetical protein
MVSAMVPLLTEQSLLSCAHGGHAIPAGGTPRVLVGGVPVLTTTVLEIVGCANQQRTATGPTGVQHTVPATFCLQAIATAGASQRVTSQGVPLLLESTVLLAIPSAQKVLVSANQPRVTGG